jgi:hypothetical protein
MKWLRWSLVALCLGLLVVQLPRQLRVLVDSARNGRALSEQRRLLYPTQVYRVRYPQVFAEAAAVIPRSSGYGLVYSSGASVEPGITYAVPFARSWLYPRRPGLTGAGSWILDWGTPPGALTPKAEKIVRLAPGVWAIKPSAP